MTRPICQICARRWGKSLWEHACHCTGHVSLLFTMPGPRNTTVVPKTQQKAPVIESARKKSR